MRQLPSFLSHFLSFCAVDHEGWAPTVCSLPHSYFSLFASSSITHLALAAFFLFLGTPAHPAVMSVSLYSSPPHGHGHAHLVLLLWTLHCAYLFSKAVT